MTDRTSEVVLVTGGARRLGAAIVRAVASSGRQVAIHHGHSPREADELAREIEKSGGHASVFAADLENPSACEGLIDEVLARWGRLDHLVSSAAVFERTPFGGITAEAWDRVLALNVRASALLAQAAAPQLARRRGSMVLVTCTSATAPYRNFLPYVVSKGAAKQLMRALALELAPNVRVNAVAPGTVLPPEHMQSEEREILAQRTLLERTGSGEDVAGAVLYLLDAPFVTGVEILVDGGVALTGRPSGER